MLNFIIVYDHLDQELGTFFEGCKVMLEEFLSHQPFVNLIECLDGHSASQMSVDLKIASMNDANFIFVAYSHGSTDGNTLLCRSAPFLIKEINTGNFSKAIVYTTACSAGKELGKDLTSQGCLAFWGNKEPVEALLGEYRKKSILIDNYGILLFLGSDKTIYECFIATIAYYNLYIDKLDEIYYDTASAAILTYNRDALVFYGDPQLTKEHLFN